MANSQQGMYGKRCLHSRDREGISADMTINGAPIAGKLTDGHLTASASARAFASLLLLGLNSGCRVR
jgi:hypothetical protein